MMELFDKRFVHFIWDDKLEGKEGFFADDICELTNCVHSGNLHLAKASKSLSPAFPFKDTNNNDWLFFYYDPNYSIKKAFNEGKKVQVRCANGTWINCDEPKWYDDCAYRTKPEEEKWIEEHKPTDELEKEKCELLGLIQGKDKVIADLKKKNVELKSIADFQTSSNMDRYFQLKRSKGRLAKAKDILKRLLEEEKNNMFWEMNGSNKGSYYKVRKEAERFLKEVQK